MPEQDYPEYLNNKQAIRYLCEVVWGIDDYSEDAFRALCFRQGYKADLGEGRSAKFWKKPTLDKMPKPDKSAPRRKRKARGSEGKSGGYNSGTWVSRVQRVAMAG